jgi:lipopolysaccharide export system permease protein
LILDRYIIAEILKPMLAILGILLAIFVSYSAAAFLADAVIGSLPVSLIAYVVFLRIGVALEVLLPTTLFISVIIAMGRLHNDLEMTALAACGVGLPRIIRPVLVLAAGVSLLAFGASVFLRPWSYERIYRLKEQAKLEFSLPQLKGGHYYQLDFKSAVFFSEAIDEKLRQAKRVFVRSEDGDNVQVIWAEEVYQRHQHDSDRKVLVFTNGVLYQFEKAGEGGKVTRFNQAEYYLDDFRGGEMKYRRKAASTGHLIKSDSLEDIAELQWRISTPLSTLLLALLGVPLSRTSAGKGKYSKVLSAMIIFAVYYNLFVIAKTWVEKGVWSPMIGIWWVPALLAGLAAFLLLKTGEVFRRPSPWHNRPG